MGQLNGNGQLSQLHIGQGSGHHQASSPNLLSAASQSYQIGSAAANSAPTMITHHQLSPVSANITLMGQSNGKSKYHYIRLSKLRPLFDYSVHVMGSCLGYNMQYTITYHIVCLLDFNVKFQKQI